MAICICKLVLFNQIVVILYFWLTLPHCEKMIIFWYWHISLNFLANSISSVPMCKDGFVRYIAFCKFLCLQTCELKIGSIISNHFQMVNKIVIIVYFIHFKVGMFFNLILIKINYSKTWRYISILTILKNLLCLANIDIR